MRTKIPDSREIAVPLVSGGWQAGPDRPPFAKFAVPDEFHAKREGHADLGFRRDSG